MSSIKQTCYANLHRVEFDTHLEHIFELNVCKIREPWWLRICLNPSAIQFISRHVDRLSDRALVALSLNPNHSQIKHMIGRSVSNMESLTRELMWSLCRDPNAVAIVQPHISKLDSIAWLYLERNPRAKHLMYLNPYIKATRVPKQRRIKKTR